jgi:hypothetical protein
MATPPVEPAGAADAHRLARPSTGKVDDETRPLALGVYRRRQLPFELLRQCADHPHSEPGGRSLNIEGLRQARTAVADGQHPYVAIHPVSDVDQAVPMFGGIGDEFVDEQSTGWISVVGIVPWSPLTSTGRSRIPDRSAHKRPR